MRLERDFDLDFERCLLLAERDLDLRLDLLTDRDLDFRLRESDLERFLFGLLFLFEADLDLLLDAVWAFREPGLSGSRFGLQD